MKRLLPLLLLLLAGCTSSLGVPSYVVMLTNNYYSMGPVTRCTGVLVDPQMVLTAAHCVEAVERAIMPDGQEAWVSGSELLEQADVALLFLDSPIRASQYATIGHPKTGQIAQIFGTCPYFWSHQVRLALYSGMLSLQYEDGTWVDFDQWVSFDRQNAVCGGDSGGPIIQDGVVVGVTSAVESRNPFVAYGVTFYSAPSTLVNELLEDYLARH